jgi:hypothetical protein
LAVHQAFIAGKTTEINKKTLNERYFDTADGA